MAKEPRAYQLDGKRITPSRFRRLSRARKILAMVEWFGNNFEDPANRISYVTREGGYQWAGYGPHDADEKLQEEFGDLVEFETIQYAVGEITNEGTFDWASTKKLNEYDPLEEDEAISPVNEPLPDWWSQQEIVDGDGDEWPPIIGVLAEEQELKSELLSRLDRLEAALHAYANQRAHRGHNNPPELVGDDDPLNDVDLAVAHTAVTDLREEVEKEEPDAQRVQRIATVLLGVAQRLWKSAKLAAEVIGVVGAIGGAAIWTYQHHEKLYVAAMEAASAASEWGQHVADFW